MVLKNVFNIDSTLLGVLGRASVAGLYAPASGVIRKHSQKYFYPGVLKSAPKVLVLWFFKAIF